jgi:hypothetical protein
LKNPRAYLFLLISAGGAQHSPTQLTFTMAKLSFALAAALAASASAFAPASSSMKKTALSAEKSWDPMSLGKLGQGEAFDTFPGMFPDYQYLNESEIKHGRMSMLAWTGIWATHVVSAFCCNLLYCGARFADMPFEVLTIFGVAVSTLMHRPHLIHPHGFIHLLHYPAFTYHTFLHFNAPTSGRYGTWFAHSWHACC